MTTAKMTYGLVQHMAVEEFTKIQWVKTPFTTESISYSISLLNVSLSITEI